MSVNYKVIRIIKTGSGLWHTTTEQSWRVENVSSVERDGRNTLFKHADGTILASIKDVDDYYIATE